MPTPRTPVRRTLAWLAALAGAAGACAALAAGASTNRSDAGATAARTGSEAAVRVLYRRGLRGAAGPRGFIGPRGPVGPRTAGSVLGLSINWRGLENVVGRDSAAVAIAGIGTLTATCNPGIQRLVLVPAAAGVRTTVTVTGFEASQTATSQLSSQSPDQPIVIASALRGDGVLAPNGMLAATISVQPVQGAGGAGPAPATLTLSSEYILNDPDAADAYCFVAGQVIAGG